MNDKKPYSDARWHDYDPNLLENGIKAKPTKRTAEEQKTIEKGIQEWKNFFNLNE